MFGPNIKMYKTLITASVSSKPVGPEKKRTRRRRRREEVKGKADEMEDKKTTKKW